MVKTTRTSKLDLLDTFVLSGVITVLVTRAFLYISDFPQISNDTLHIAHVLWGGLMMLLAFLILLLSTKPDKLLTSLVGGIGFGLFVDEVGKFMTKDNDYFYEPAIMVMYILFIVIWFASRLLIVRSSNEKFLSPAEWPRQPILTLLIKLWVGSQALIGIVVTILVFGQGFNEVNDALNITGFGMIAGLFYGGFLSFASLRIYQNRFTDAAHIIRGATIFAILIIYPFIFFKYPYFATLCMLLTIPVTIGLSKVSIVGLFKNLIRHS